MNEFNQLPFEIIIQILQEFTIQLDEEREFALAPTTLEPYLRRSSYAELINLRLISKTWSKAVILFYFETISINDSRRANVLLDNWEDDLFEPWFDCPVKRLRIERVWYSVEEGPAWRNGSTSKEIEKRSLPVSMDQLARLIKLLGKNLKTLNIHFIRCMAASPDLIKAIQSIKALKSLTISYESGKEHGTYDEDSMSELFSTIPKLENLSLHHDTLLPFLIKPATLPNLRFFSLIPVENNREVNLYITQTAKDTIKAIELFTDTKLTRGFKQVLEPIKETLEGFFTTSFTEQLMRDVTDLTFPKLRVIRTQCQDYDEDLSEISWLEVPMLKNVRTIVTDLHNSDYYWRYVLRSSGPDGLKKVPNFKHIVFTKHKHSETQAISSKLIEAFKSFGVQCHLSHELTSDEILELDYKLNGPMK